jgi:hypothetical protein
MEYPPGYLASEVSIHWRVDPSQYRYVRERVFGDMPATAAPPRDYYGNNGDTKIIGYAVCDPRKRDSQKSRRIFFVRESDLTRPAPGCPVEACDPLSVVVGEPSETTERCWGGPLPKSK